MLIESLGDLNAHQSQSNFTGYQPELAFDQRSIEETNCMIDIWLHGIDSIN